MRITFTLEKYSVSENFLSQLLSICITDLVTVKTHTGHCSYLHHNFQTTSAVHNDILMNRILMFIDLYPYHPMKLNCLPLLILFC